MQDNDIARVLGRRLNLLSLLVLANTLFMLAIAGLFRFGLLSPAESDGKVPKDSAIDQLRYKYGKAVYSQFDEETLIRSFFRDKRGGFFVDVGASYYCQDSTTFYLEERLGWKGIAIDANPEYKADYDEHRPATKFFSFFVGDKSDGDADFYLVPSNPRVGSFNVEHVAKFSSVQPSAPEIKKLKVPNITLNKLLDHEQVKTIDLLSIDIEGAELSALAGFDIQRFKPKLVCIEVDHSLRKSIEDYFTTNGYKRVEAYVPMDQHNWYFAPKIEKVSNPSSDQAETAPPASVKK